ncbi:MAG: enoyl-CoA hydratase/isomerase family protein, partial [Alphaproteobacteria bacterium]|nr:enoyl-CoA hydratase/isomerase family protein [Alphaproteobacteria bacterium]
MTYEKILYSVTDNVACITLNDPATLNALSQTMGRELQDALNRGAQEARAILLTGAGKAFSSGANLTSQDFDMADPQRDVGALLEATFNAITLKLKSSPVPVVSAVRGAAAGIGCAYALAADIIIASENAYFLQAFCNVGLV